MPSIWGQLGIAEELQNLFDVPTKVGSLSQTSILLTLKLKILNNNFLYHFKLILIILLILLEYALQTLSDNTKMNKFQLILIKQQQFEKLPNRFLKHTIIQFFSNLDFLYLDLDFSDVDFLDLNFFDLNFRDLDFSDLGIFDLELYHPNAIWFKVKLLCLTWSQGRWSDSIFQL